MDEKKGHHWDAIPLRGCCTQKIAVDSLEGTQLGKSSSAGGKGKNSGIEIGRGSRTGGEGKGRQPGKKERGPRIRMVKRPRSLVWSWGARAEKRNPRKITQRVGPGIKGSNLKGFAYPQKRGGALACRNFGSGRNAFTPCGKEVANSC